MLRFNRQNTLKPVVPSKAGIYTFYDQNRRLLYVGHSRNLRHRVQSYRQVDDFNEHPTKRQLRKNIQYYKYQTMPVNEARYVERKLKHKALHNHL